MAWQVWCPGCGTKRMTAPGAIGVWVKCYGCQARITLPAAGELARELMRVDLAPPEDGTDDGDDEYPFRPGWPMLYWVLLSAVWVAVGWNLALWAHRWPGWASPFGYAAVGLTVWLIVGNVRRCFRAAWATGFTVSALPLSLAQLALFQLLFFQFAAHLGHDHFRWEQTPAASDWLAFGATHLIRAVDFCDFADFLGWKTTQIHPVGVLSGTSVAAYRLLADLFLIGVLFDLARKLRERRTESRPPSDPGLRSAFVWLGILVMVSVFAMTEGQTIGQLFWWFADNGLRVLDFADVMQLADWRLHPEPASWSDRGVSITIRVLLTVAVAEPLFRSARGVRLNTLGAVGMSEEQLQEAAESRDPEMARRARSVLRRMGCFRRHAVGMEMSRRGKWAAAIFGPAILIGGAAVARFWGG